MVSNNGLVIQGWLSAHDQHLGLGHDILMESPISLALLLLRDNWPIPGPYRREFRYPSRPRFSPFPTLFQKRKKNNSKGVYTTRSHPKILAPNIPITTKKKKKKKTK